MTAKRVFSVIGMIIGCVMVLFGVFDLSPHFIGETRSTLTEFGADFYTDVYQASAAAANNLDDIGELMNMILALSGFVVICHFGCKLGETFSAQGTSSVQATAVMRDELPKL